jgi:hypothetical protein
MRVVVLAGGTGTRLGYDGQKCCIPIAGRPFLHWKLDQLYEHGATHIDILVSHAKAEVAETVHLFPDITLYEDPGTGPWNAIRWYALSQRPPKSFLVTYGDTLLDVPFPDVVNSMLVTRHTGPHIRPNLLGEWVDAGLYRIGADHPFAERWRFLPTATRPWTLNTPEQYEETDAYLRRHSES